MAGLAALSVVRFWGVLELGVVLQCAALGAYGTRLGVYLIRREAEPAYKRELADIQQRGVGIGRVKQVAIWLGVSLLYVLMFSPALFNLLQLREGQPLSWTVWAGLALMGPGFALE